MSRATPVTLDIKDVVVVGDNVRQELVTGPWRAVLNWLSWQIATDDIDSSDVSMVRISGGPE